MEVQQVFVKHVTVLVKLVKAMHYCVHLVMMDTTLSVHIVFLFTISFYRLDLTWTTMLYLIFWIHFYNGLLIR